MVIHIFGCLSLSSVYSTHGVVTTNDSRVLGQWEWCNPRRTCWQWYGYQWLTSLSCWTAVDMVQCCWHRCQLGGPPPLQWRRDALPAWPPSGACNRTPAPGRNHNEATQGTSSAGSPSHSSPPEKSKDREEEGVNLGCQYPLVKSSLLELQNVIRAKYDRFSIKWTFICSNNNQRRRQSVPPFERTP